MTQFPETVKSSNLVFGFAQSGRCSEGLAHRLALDFASQTVVGAVAWLARLMTATARLTALAGNRGDRAAAKITKLHNLAQNGGSLLFEIGKRLRQKAPPILTYQYVRIGSQGKSTCPYIYFFVAHPSAVAGMPAVQRDGGRAGPGERGLLLGSISGMLAATLRSD